VRILVVDDDRDSLQSLCLVLQDLGHDPQGLPDPFKALEEARQNFYPLVITDIRMPGMDGISLLTALKEIPELGDSDVVLITGHGDMATAVDALRKGAYDYLNKPINARELAAVVERSAEHQSLIRENYKLRHHLEDEVSRTTADLQRDLVSARNRLREVDGVGPIIAESPAMRAILREARILHTDPSVPVLIEGETGTGKELVARTIHYGDESTDLPFLAINCAAIPHELFESELFGHEAGAFTGSRTGGSQGKLEQAGKGTLFLDEVAEMPLSLQPKLLRALQERTFFRVGGMKKRAFTARLVCAGNRDMAAMVEKGSFRRDLYHRLRVGYIRIPPLRERREDILPLAEYFLRREAKKKKKKFREITPEALAALARHPWPGNIREMENAIERAVLLHEGTALSLEHLEFQEQNSPAAGREPPAPSASPPLRPDLALPEEGLDLEAHIDTLVRAALDRFQGNQVKAAKYLGISRFALRRRLQGQTRCEPS
jgi:DNA-binding NtrC family response regulator